MDGEVVIRGGMVVGGTGAPPRQADVATAGGRISALGERLRGDRELDARGQVVAPGFIDIHAHHDAQVFWDPWLTPSAFHGVTSVIAGNCGFSIAPIRSGGVELMAHTLQHVEDMSFETLSVGVPWQEFETFPEYLRSVERSGTALNYGCYVGHTAVRLCVMGEEAYERPAAKPELARMQEVVDESIAAGAIGFSSSASPTHNGDHGRPVPSRVADLAELRCLLEPLRARDRGVAALLPGGVITNQEVFELQRHVGRPFTWTALLTIKGHPYHEEVVAEHEAARSEGIDVWPQVSCRPLVFQMNMLEPFTLNIRKSFADLMDSSFEQRVAAYRDPSWREEAWREVSERGGALPVDWGAPSVAESPSRSDLVNRPVAELAEEWDCTPLEVMLDISLGEDLQTRFWSVLANNDPEGIAWLLPLDGLELSGDGDIAPELYGEGTHLEAGGFDHDRDMWESALLGEALLRQIQVPDICRGIQLFNVHLGGTLLQHLPEVAGHTAHRPGPGRFADVEAVTVPGTWVAETFGARETVDGPERAVTSSPARDEESFATCDGKGSRGWINARGG